MKPFLILSPIVLVFAFFMLCQVEAQTNTDREDGFLKRQGNELILDGKPFYELSFNKFDLFWQLLEAEFGTTGYGDHPAETAEQALKELHGFGFKTIRVFCFSWTLAEYFDLEKRPKYLAVMDRMLDLCDKYDLRIVFSLGVGQEPIAKLLGENGRDLVCRRDSKSRKRVEEYLTGMVSRYKDRKTIAMWEHTNELMLMADIGGKERVWMNTPVPTLDEVVQFHADMAALIRSIDRRHLITTGDGYRSSSWHLYQFGLGKTDKMWGLDTMEQVGQAVSLAQQAVDAFCIHDYYGTEAFGFNPIMGQEGKAVPLKLADWRKITDAVGQPFYIGEIGALAMKRSPENEKFWTDNPNWFESYEDSDNPNAKRIVRLVLDQILEAKPALTHWWTYQSNRNVDQNDPQRFDIDIRRTPDLVRMIVDANRKLQMETMGLTYMK